MTALPEGYDPDNLMGNVVDCVADRLDDVAMIPDDANAVEWTCRLIAKTYGDGDYTMAEDEL